MLQVLCVCCGDFNMSNKCVFITVITWYNWCVQTITWYNWKIAINSYLFYQPPKLVLTAFALRLIYSVATCDHVSPVGVFHVWSRESSGRVPRVITCGKWTFFHRKRSSFYRLQWLYFPLWEPLNENLLPVIDIHRHSRLIFFIHLLLLLLQSEVFQ